MSFLDKLKGMFGKKDAVEQMQDQVVQAVDQNNDGQVNTADLGGVQAAADLNQDGAVNQEDLAAVKDKLTGQM